MAATFSFLFIDDVYLKTYTPVGKSIDVDQIYPFVGEAQDIYIQDLLGTPLYNELEYKLYSGLTFSQPYFTSYEIELVNLCSKSLAYWSVYLALPHLSIQIRNIGLGRAVSDNTSSGSLEDLRYIRDEMKNLAEFWAQRVVNYLCENSEYFPLYRAASPDIYPQNWVYDSDIYIEEVYKDLTADQLKLLQKYIGK
jgi:hypothetical protein